MRAFLKQYYIYILLAVVLACCIIGISIVYAGAPADIPPPKQKYSEETVCVEPVAIMRKQHFEYMLEHRDETVINGIRTKKHSLNECIDCHITANAEGEYARYSEETHFCASCHQYTAVNIDCFQCHADRPEQAVRKSLTSKQHINQDSENIHNYLELSHTKSK